MKSKPNAVLLLAALLIAAAGGAAGWIGRGIFALRPTARQATAPPTAEISRPGSSSAATPTSQSPTGVNAAESKALAAQLLQEALVGSRDKGRDQLLKARFDFALAGCDEAAVAEMIETLTRNGNDPAAFLGDPFTLIEECCSILVARMTEMNPWRALQCLVGLLQVKLECPPSAFQPVLERLSTSALLQAQAVIEKLPPGAARTTAELAWLRARVKFDPDAVFQHLMNLDDATFASMRGNDHQLPDLITALSVEAPEKALQTASRFSVESRTPYLGDLLRGWLQREPKAAVQWAIEQNDAIMYAVCFRTLGSEQSGLDEKFLRDNFSSINSKEPAYRAALAGDLAARLAEQDLPESVRWAATLPADARDAANLALARTWIKQDLPAAAEWLTTWPAGKSKDVAVEALTGAILKDDPESALTWAASIQAKRRFYLMQKALDTLTGKDPAAVERAMQTLSEDDRAVLSVIKRTGLGE